MLIMKQNSYEYSAYINSTDLYAGLSDPPGDLDLFIAYMATNSNKHLLELVMATDPLQ